MQTSIFLAKLIGPVALLMGLVILLDPVRIRTMAREVLQGEAFLFMSGLLTLTLGLALVNTHNTWTPDWRVLITLIGWLTIVAGVARMAFGGQIKALGAAMIDNNIALTVPGIAMTAIGAWLSYVAYLG